MSYSLLPRALVLAAWVSLSAVRAQAGQLNDLWWNPSESGWGANVIQQDDTLVVTLFVYGADGKPAWYIGPNTQRQGYWGPSYSGPLYATSGPWFVGSFDPQGVSARSVGTIAFTPGDDGTAVLAYSVDGAQVTKTVERQTWRRIPFVEPPTGIPDRSMPYSGTVQIYEFRAGWCAGGTALDSKGTFFRLTTAPIDDRSGTIDLRLSEHLALSGTYVQNGSVFRVTLSGSVASNGLTFLPAGQYEGHIDPLVVDGLFVYGYVRLLGNNGCRMSLAVAGHVPVTAQFLQHSARLAESP